MKQKHLLSKLLLLVAVFVMGAGTAWAQAPVNTILWEETWTGGAKSKTPSAYGFEGTTVYGGATLTYAQSSNNTILYEEALAGGTSPELLLSKSNQTWTISNIPTGQATEMSLTFLSNKTTFAVTSSTTGITISGSGKSWTITAISSVQKFDLTIKNTGSSNARIDNIVLKVTTAGTGDKESCDLALTGAPIALSFDLYNNSAAHIINYTSSSTGAVTVSQSDYVTTSVDQTNKTITVTPKASVTPSVQTLTVSQAADDDYAAGSTTFTVTIDDSTPIPTHSVTFSVNGTATTEEFEEGAAITFPANPADIEGKTFVGWTESAITGVTDEAPTFVNAKTMGTEALTFYAVFAEKTAGTQTNVTDVLSKTTLGQIGSTNNYADFSGKSISNGSNAVYAGNCILVENIQIRSNNSNSGIVSTTSGGMLKSVTVTWASGTTNGRTLDIYGSNTAYSLATDLYNSNSQGTKLGSIVKGTSTSLTVSGDYAYIGLRSNSGAMYFDEISIEWTAGTPDTYSDYCTTVVAATVAKPVITVAENPFFFSTTATINCATEGAAIKYSFDGETWYDYSEALTLTETKTIYAKAVKDSDESTVAQVTATKNLAEPTVTIDDSGITNTNVFEGEEAGNLSATVTYNGEAISGATVVWSGDNDAVATIDENGAVTLVGAGSVTFTATFAGNDDFNGATATYEMTVTNSDPNANDGSAEKPYTVAEAIAFINTLDSSTSANDIYVSGIISQVDSYNSTYNSITYWISDDGTTTSQMEVYSGKNLNGEGFSSKDDLKVGDIVTVKGKVKMYNTTPEFVQNNELVSFERPADTTPRISVSPQTIDAPFAGADGTLSVTYENIDNLISFDIQFCDANGDELQGDDPDWITAEVNEPSGENGYTVSYVIDANDGEARTAYFKVYTFVGEGLEEVYSNLVTINQAELVVIIPAELPFAFKGGKADIGNTDGLTQEGLGTDYNASTNPTTQLKFDGTGDWLLLQFDERPGTLTFDIKGNSFSGGTFTVQTSEDGITYSDLEAYTELGDADTKTFDNLGENVRYIKWIYTEKSSGNVGLGNINLTAYGDTPEPQQYTLTVEPFENLEIITFVNDEMVLEEDGEIQVNEGDQIMLSVVASEGYVMETLMVNGVNHVNDIADDFTYSFEMPDEDVAISATAVEYVAPTPGEWVLTDLANLTEDDVFVIVGNNGNTYAMSNDEGTEKGPVAVAITVVDNTLSGTIDDNLMWNVSVNEDGYIFYPNGNHEVWLYCTNSNNGVRVGTNENNNLFIVYDGYLKNVATSRYVGIYNSQDWRCYTSTTGSSNIADQTFSFFKKVNTEGKEIINISAAGYATYCSENALDFSNVQGLTAYKATIANNQVGFTPVTEVPAGEGVLLKGAKGAFVVPIIESADALDDNAFIGVTEQTTITTEPENGIFVLMNGSNGVGFYKTTGSSFTVGAHTAYLPALASGDGARTFIGFDVATGIANLNANVNLNGEVYNLQGQRVSSQFTVHNSQLKKGLYIVNGKKVVIK